MAEYCREDLGRGRGYCKQKADLILWGKLFPPEALGPRCLRHAGNHMPTDSKSIEQWAVFDLRPTEES